MYNWNGNSDYIWLFQQYTACLHLYPTMFKKKGGERFRTANPKRCKENSNMKLPKSKNKQTEGVKGKLAVVMKSWAHSEVRTQNRGDEGLNTCTV